MQSLDNDLRLGRRRSATTDQLSNKKWIVVSALIGCAALIFLFFFVDFDGVASNRRCKEERRKKQIILEGMGINTSANSLFYGVKFLVRQPSFIFQTLKSVLNLYAN